MRVLFLWDDPLLRFRKEDGRSGQIGIDNMQWSGNTNMTRFQYTVDNQGLMLRINICGVESTRIWTETREWR